MKILQLLGRISLSVFLAKRIQSMKDRSLLYRGRPYSDSAIASWCKFLSLWQDYTRTLPREKTIKALSTADFDALMNYCDERGFRESTRMLIASLFKAALTAAYAEGVIGRPVRWAQDHAVSAPRDTEAKKIWLNSQEIEALSALPLPPRSPLRKALDIFLIGCYTGQRFSDYRQLSLTDVVIFDFDGEACYAFRKKQKKTGAEVYIPIIKPEVLRILERWGGSLPTLSNSLLNREIKTLCRMAGIDEPVKVVERIGGRERVRVVPKYELVASHTARRSFITQCYLEGRLTEMQIRSISGHRSSHSFRRYLCYSSRDNLKGIFEALRDKP